MKRNAGVSSVGDERCHECGCPDPGGPASCEDLRERAEAAEARAAKAEAHKCEERKIAYWVDSNGEQVWAWVGKGEQAAFEKKTEEQRAKGLYQPTWKARAEALEAIVRKARDALKNARNRQVNILELERQMNNALRESAPAGADNIQAPAWPLHEAKPAEASRRPKR